MAYNINLDELEEDTKIQCPKCAEKGNDNSHDNLHFYSKELGAHCFCCGFTIPSQEYLDESNINKVISKGAISMVTQKDKDALINKALTPEQVKEIEAKTSPTINVKYRGIPSSVYESLGVRWEGGGDTGQPISMYYPITVTEDGKQRVVGYKVRRHPKDFYSIGYVGKLGGFLNQSNAVADTLILVSGEVDLASAIHGLEMDKYRKSYNVVSSPLGEDSTAMMIKLNYDWVNSHKKIVVCMDNDLAGEKAFEKIKEVIDAEKLFKANIALNDLNDYLKEGRGAEIANCIYWSPTPVKTFGIKGSGNSFEKMLEVLNTERIPLPAFLKGLDEPLSGGIPTEEILNVISSISTGKSVFTTEIVLDWILRSPHKMFIISLEDGVGTYTAKLASRVTGIKILALRTIEEKNEVAMKHKEEIERFLKDENGADRYNILDEIPNSIEGIQESIIQAIKVYGCKIILIDPIQSILGTKSNEEQASFMNFQEATRRSHGVTFINICHTRKTGSGAQAHSEGGLISEEDIKGSSQIGATATINMILRRNKLAECEIEKNTTYVDLVKNRTVGATGRNLAKIYYSNQHHTLFDFDYAEENNFFKDVTPEELKLMLDTSKASPATPDVSDDNDIEIIESF